MSEKVVTWNICTFQHDMFHQASALCVPVCLFSPFSLSKNQGRNESPKLKLGMNIMSPI